MDAAETDDLYRQWRDLLATSTKGQVQLANLAMDMKLGWLDAATAAQTIAAIAALWDKLGRTGNRGIDEAEAVLNSVKGAFPDLTLRGPSVKTNEKTFARLVDASRLRLDGANAIAGQAISPRSPLARAHRPDPAFPFGLRGGLSNRAKQAHNNMRKRLGTPRTASVIWVSPAEDILRHIRLNGCDEGRDRVIIAAGLPHLRGKEVVMQTFSGAEVRQRLHKPTTIDSGGYAAYCGDLHDDGFGVTASLETAERGLREAVFSDEGIIPDATPVELGTQRTPLADANHHAICRRLFDTGCRLCPSPTPPNWPNCGLDKMPKERCP